MRNKYEKLKESIQSKVILFFRRISFMSKLVRVSGGSSFPKFRWLPFVMRAHYNKYWGLYGFHFFWLGAEIYFSFGEDKKGLYKDVRKNKTSKKKSVKGGTK